MLDTGASAAMTAPCSVLHDSPPAKHRRDELVDAPVPSVCEYTLVPPAQRLDRRATAVNRIIPVARATTSDGDHGQIATADQDLCVA